MLLNQGELEGAHLLGRKTVELMTQNHLPTGLRLPDDPAFGFGLGGYVLLDVAQSRTLGSKGAFGWGGAANTAFWIDPKEGLSGLFMTQFMPSGHYPAAQEFQVLVYQALK